MANPLMYLEFGAADVPRTARFFRDVFGWQFRDITATRYSSFSSGPSGLSGGIQHLDKIEPGGGMILYIAVEDIETHCKYIAAAGGKVTKPRTEIPGVGWFALFADLDGNQFGLFTQHPENAKQY